MSKELDEILLGDTKRKFTIWNDGGEWIVSMEPKAMLNCKTLREFIEPYAKHYMKTRLEADKSEALKKYIDSLPYYGSCTQEYNEGIEDGVKWLEDKLLNDLK